MKTRAIYPGTFDPLTNGHVDIIKRALELFDEIYIAVANNTGKSPLFLTKERMDFLRKATARFKGVFVESLDGLVIDYARQKGISTIIRGIRATSDFDYEFQMALTNRKLCDKVQTIFLIPSETHFYLSSRLIKEVARLGGDIKDFVPPYVEKKLKEKLAGL